MIIGDDIPITNAYETNPLDEQEAKGCAHHLAIDMKKYRAGSFIDRRLAAHKFAAMLLRYKPDLELYPERVIREWVPKISGIDPDRMITNEAFDFYARLPTYLPWRQLLWHFFPPDLEYHPSDVLSAFERYNPAKTLDTSMINRWLVKRAGSVVLNPITYRAILAHVCAQTIIDLHPELGTKALACGMSGIHYIYKPCPEIEFARERGIERLLGMTMEPLDDQKADVIVSDANFKKFDITGAARHLGQARTMLAYAPRAERIELTEKYNPTKIIKVLSRFSQERCRKFIDNPDFLLIW